MDTENEMFRILREEYGITNEKQLDEAIRKQGFLNLAPFCLPQKEREEKPA